MIVAFFDFDGTITRRDTFIDFAIHVHGKKKVVKALFLHFFSVIGYKLGWVSGHVMKEKLLTYFFKEMSEKVFINHGKEYCQKKLPKHIRNKALEKIKWHQSQQHKVVMVTASLETWTQPFCDALGIALIATKIKIKNQKLTGELLGENCIGVEKVKRIKQEFQLEDMIDSYAYGNSVGDKEMLAFANKAYYKVF